MNPRVILAVVSIVVAGAAKLISKFRDGDDEQEEENESASVNDSNETKTSTETDSQTHRSEPNEGTDAQTQHSETKKQSWQAHKRATNREPPVRLGGAQKLCVEEIMEHHSGSQTARGKVEGFQIFVNDVPTSVRPLDVIRVKITSFGNGRTSAEAQFIEQV